LKSGRLKVFGMSVGKLLVVAQSIAQLRKLVGDEKEVKEMIDRSITKDNGELDLVSL
jgi:hypothetical protein